MSPFVSARQSASLSHFGGDEGNRTPDPLLAGQVLSQLSYTPMSGELVKRAKKIEQQTGKTLFVVIFVLSSCQTSFSKTASFRMPLAMSP